MLLCGFDPAEHAVGLRCLTRFSGTDDSVAIVAMKQGVENTVETYLSVVDTSDRASIGVVDTVSEGQTLSAIYDEVSTVFRPSEGETERLVLALRELTNTLGV